MEEPTEQFEIKVLLDNLEKAKAQKIEKLKKLLEKDEERLSEEITKLENEYEENKREILKQKVALEEVEDMDISTNFFLCYGENLTENYCIKHGIKENEIMHHLNKFSYNILGFNVPAEIWNSLFEYQKTGVKWMLGLFKNEMGGILADDMGLGKTIQTISYISILLFNNKINNGVILCPVTVKDQWSKEWSKIYPFVKTNLNFGEGIHIMSYEKFKDIKFVDWDILVLDEGHKIKNKDTKISKYLKSFSIRHKLVLTGTPIQNNLGELWSLMNFVNPHLLGPYSIFKEEFEIPISQGGYQRASKAKQDVAYKYSLVLKGLIDPFILRRMKQEIDLKLPSKSDKIYFCALTERQRILYQQTIESEYIGRVLNGEVSLFSGIDILRKICNHPALLKRNADPQDSCKLNLLHQLLVKWKNDNLKVLVFSQTIKMLNIIEESLGDYKYLRMDGETPISKRTEIIEQFNTDETITVFLLTSRVGGLGLNLVGASRIVIFDPDWNPSTDNQAKERIWRYGQKKDVEILRFICKDTIEEKIYKRQIFKNALSNKILRNANFSSSVDKSCIEDLFDFKVVDNKKAPGVKIENTISEEMPKLDFVKENDKIDVNRMQELVNKKKMSGKDLLEYILLREKQLSKKFR
ncbi:Protein CHROMATIN REMODELING 8 [Nosema granulosis]|uniref:Protein CHROMATIN REMODELING 8 n=1 Tax=Nosema granulosis TaxID=83296 RepID=A0A9P6GXT4_9MICR|nr:Protein CHROMATIN REMODELING 8 [Nosema granulosis]